MLSPDIMNYLLPNEPESAICLNAEPIFADTNLFLRYLTNDIPKQADAIDLPLNAPVLPVDPGEPELSIQGSLSGLSRH